MILRNYKGRERSVGKQQMRSFFLLHEINKISSEFPILKEAKREVMEDVMDVETSLEVLKEILSDIDSAAQDPTHQTSNEILANIRSTMSDSASTEVKFNELLEEYRTTILPYTIENYNLLDAAQKESVGKLLNFFCGLHSLVHFAETSSKALVKVENEIFNNSIPIKDPSFKKSSESGTTRLVRTACKAFARGADEKSGCH